MPPKLVNPFLRKFRLLSFTCISLLVLSPFSFAFIEALHSSPRQWHSFFPQGLAKATLGKQPILLEFYAPWCSLCRKLRDKVYPSEEVRSITRKYILIRINGEKNPDLLHQFDVKGYPTILLLDSNGARLDKLDGFINSSALARKLRDTYRQKNRRQKFLDHLSHNPKNMYSNFDAGVYYFEIGSYEKAKTYFLEARDIFEKKFENNSSQVLARSTHLEIKQESKKAAKALYNACVSLMHLDHYLQATLCWNRYLKNDTSNKNSSMNHHDLVHSRYYRGLSLYYQGKKNASKSDLKFASQKLSSLEDRENAELLIRMIDKKQK